MPFSRLVVLLDSHSLRTQTIGSADDGLCSLEMSVSTRLLVEHTLS
jgi:hypothetical protein